jgi:hypothetical protein
MSNSETVNDYVPGRSLFAEITEMREEMTILRAAMVKLVELQQELAQKVEAALSKNPITDGEDQAPAQVV